MAFEWELALQPQAGFGSGNLGRIECNDRVRIMDANRTCIPDLQTLIVGLESGNDHLRLHAGLVVEWAIGSCMHFENAAWSIGFRRCVERKQTLDRHSLGIERCMHVMSASQLHGSTRLDEALGYLRIE